ncbi:MAG: DUF1353 domain-containing protein [Gammaproteobacteria bacterium]|nr:DUF1353 domain-containing protein [Gammaproteobacteria bacterium]
MKGVFTDLVLRTLDEEPGVFEVVNSFTYEGSSFVRVPEGTKTDLASIPWGMRNLFAKTGRSRKPAVVHDHLYECKWQTRKICDQLFREMLRARGYSRFQAGIFYAGVRAGGWTRGTKDTRAWTWH